MITYPGEFLRPNPTGSVNESDGHEERRGHSYAQKFLGGSGAEVAVAVIHSQHERILWNGMLGQGADELSHREHGMVPGEMLELALKTETAAETSG